MLDLLRGRSAKGIYKRPSGHTVTEKTFHDNGGALPSHLISISNTDSNGAYLRACKAAGISPHPARFPSGLPEFFIKLLTDPDDLVIDFFAGSNTTGAVAQGLGRRWMSCDLDPSYVAASAFRLMMPDDDPAAVYASVLAGPTVYMRPR
jgi:site-specific DNA-methyltransferase (cytosine-N4-specific)